ncbi:MAG: hypothetical protein GXP31_00495 [Kiritimatiellaeota bacterium]|nr:hypothetical protein [Kiritimatiellota bacterium]
MFRTNRNTTFLIAIAMFIVGDIPARSAADPATGQPLIRIKPGQYRLLDRPLARIGFRLYDHGGPVFLGMGWRGEDPATGVQFRMVSSNQGRPVWFAHCPWRKGPGLTFANFRLDLPPVKPIRLVISVGIREDAPHSDGVDYIVTVDGSEVFRKLCKWKGLRELRIDLDRYAGRRILLQLAVDPGPARNTTDDWALWGKADIEAGTPEQIAAARRAAEQEIAERRRKDFSRAAEFAAEDLAPVSGPGARGVCPSTFEKVENTVRRRGDTVVFTARDRRDDLAFELHPAAGPTAALTVRSHGTVMKPPPFAGSMRFGPKYTGPLPPRFEAMHLDAEIGVLECTYSVAAGKSAYSAARLQVRWGLQGKSLQIEFRAPAGVFTGVNMTVLGDQTVTAPLGPAVQYREREALYLAVAGDLWHSNASKIGSTGSTYVRLTDGRHNPLHDVFYLTLSSRYEEVLPNTPYPPSPFLDDLSHRVILDVWSGNFADDALWLRQMAEYGLDHFVIIKHVWQRDGYDRTYPNTLPANAGQGGDAGLRALAQTAIGLGHRFCVHENYYDYYPSAEDFREEDCALNPDGSKEKGWQGSSVKAWFLKSSKLMDYVRKFSPEIRRRYGCNAAYHDIMPTGHIDYDARAPGAGMIRYTHSVTRQLVEFDHALYGGPVLFEGLGTTLAGLYDGGTSGPHDEEHMPVAVTPELIVVHPKQSNHGMSYYERWLEWGYGSGWSSYVMTSRERDHYRAMTIAFGRTGFIGHQLMKAPHEVVREYYLFQAFGRAYTGRRVTHIRYEGDRPGQWLDAGTASRYNRLRRLWVTYEGDRHVYVNLAPEDWHVAGHVLPQYGSMTLGPRSEAWTARIDGHIADFARFDNVVYADARSHWWHPTVDPHPIQARAVRFKDLGGGRFQIGVEWIPSRKIERDLLVFWHFRNRRGIRFQNDHWSSLRTPEWKPGAPLLDGPHTFTLPARGEGRYQFVVGLYNKEGREPLYGKSTELFLGTVNVERDREGRVRTVRFETSTHPLGPGADPAQYAAHNNSDRAVLDFGEIATNGAVVLRSDGGQRLLIPVPLGAVFDVGLHRAAKVVAEDDAGRKLAVVPVEHRDGRTWFRTAPSQARRFRVLPK